MTSSTIRAELSTVCITRSVACITVLGRTFVYAICMAGTALRIAMPTGQWETSVRMIEGRSAPAVCRMTCAAILPELTIVCILCSVTGMAVLGCAFENTVCMAGGTGSVLMLSIQLKCTFIMIEGNIFPTAGAMAGCAIRSELTCVCIFGSMATVTVRRCTSINTIGMAGLAVHTRVLTGQRKARPPVIEIHIRPATSIMTLRAVRAKLAVMPVSLLMA
ncbi:MAG: hypothetical protein WBL25_13815, partial [Anaerolineales bacterium]